MPEILGGLYSFGNRAKRQLRDLLSNPAAYLEQSAEKLRDEAGRPTSARRVAERAFNPTEADIERSAAWWNPSPLGAMAGVIKQKGGNWLAGSVEDALRGLKRTEGAYDDSARPVALNRWIEGPLTKYVKTRMASPEDEVRKLAEQGVLHVEPDITRARDLTYKRTAAGFQDQPKSGTVAAQYWNNMADQVVNPLTARDLSSAERAATFGGKSDLDPLTRVYAPEFGGGFGENLGFPHLIDELSNALDPNSGLPRHLQLTPEAMQNLSMEKAVRRVHDINEWRAAQKAEANRALAEKASLVREYAENNPKGLRWVELKAESKLPEGYSIVKDSGGYSVKSPDGKILGDGGTETAEEAVREHYAAKALADQLKYEGDVMGHCVGGYCEDVLSGRSRIFSLRDAKGEPHVTVEVAPEQADFERRVAQRELLPEEFAKRYPSELGVRIIQIKGKGNRAPNEEYLPFVQDFVRNSPLGSQWSDVGDLANTGLLANKLHPSGFITREELEAAAKNPPEGYAPEDFIWPEGYAKGGRVTPITIQPGTETATTGTRGRAWDILSE